MSKEYKAAMIVIGNEILSGRTQDKNINYVANALVEKGVRLVEVRIIPDLEEVIIKTIRELKESVDYIFTSGGIGPSHDDITAESIAKTFDVEIGVNQEAYDILLEHYGEDDFTKSRQKMALIPVGATLIPNPVSAAPGFILNEVYVMAGVPRILQAMVDYSVETLKGGSVLEARNVPSHLPESILAEGLGILQEKYQSIDIGSYPYFRDGRLGVNVVLRGTETELLNAAEQDVKGLIDSLID